MKKARNIFNAIVIILIMTAVGVGYAQDSTPAVTDSPTTVAVVPPAPTDAPVVVGTPAPELPPVVVEQNNGISREVLLLVVVVIVALILVVAMQNVTIHSQAVKLGASAPEWAWQGWKTIEGSELASLATDAKKTPDTFDDIGVDKVRQIVDEYNAEVDAVRSAQMKAAIADGIKQALGQPTATVG